MVWREEQVKNEGCAQEKSSTYIFRSEAHSPVSSLEREA